MFDSSDVQSVFSGNIAEEWEKKSRYINSLNGNDNMMIPTIKKYITSTSKILEVGCGTGKLLSQIDALTFGIELTGVEMSSDMLQQIDTLRFKNPVRLINDSVENLLKYENNELEPTLDKKLALSIALGVTLSDLSYSIEQKVANVNDNVLDQTEGSVLEETLKKVDLEEIPFASSNIIYSENIFNKIFKKDYQRYFIQFMISFFGYVLVGVYAIVSKFNIIAYICFGFAAYAVIKIIFTLIRFKNGKKEWLEQYNNVKKEYQYYNEYIKITSDDIRYSEITFNYKDIIRAIEKEGLIVCMVNSEQKAIVTIDKNTLDDESLIKVRTSIQKNCPNYINIEQMQLQKQNVNKKTILLNNIFLIPLPSNKYYS